VVVQIRKQKEEILNADRNVVILEDINHYGLINNTDKLDKYRG
jgi:hypothetical protein